MKRDEIPPQQQEPMGIIISRGSREEATPVFSAFVWGPAPEDTLPTTPAKAA